MTCRDCLHYEACLGVMEAVGIHSDFFGFNVEDRCDTFADRAKYILKGEPKTEGDRIRAMNDTNLAKFLSSIADKGETPWSKPFEERICRGCPSNPFDDCKCPPGVDIAWWLKLLVDSISVNDAP